MTKTTELTVRQQYWLKHILSCDRTGGSAKEYTEKHGLSLSGFYNARCVLKKKGAWSGTGIERVASTPNEPAKPAATFQRVTVKPAPMDKAPVVSLAPSNQTTDPCRIHLPNGVMLEVMTGAEAVALAAVIEAAGAWI